MMSFSQSIQTVYRKYFTFSGRAQRSEFWWYQLFYIVVVGLPVSYLSETLDMVWTLVNFVPSLSVAARRLHDTDRSGWWQVLPAIALPLVLYPIFQTGILGSWVDSWMFWVGVGIGGLLYLLLIVWFATPGMAGDNRFGPDPLNRTDADIFT